MKIPGTPSERDDLVRVETVRDVALLPGSAVGLFVQRLSDEKLETIVRLVPHVRHLIADGSSAGVTDQGVKHLAQLGDLEALDLEWSSITDESMAIIANMPAIRWVDLGFCAGVSPGGLAWLRQARPDLEICPSTA